MRVDHPSVVIPELLNEAGLPGAEIDVEVVGIVRLLNDLGVVTTSSCQGDPDPDLTKLKGFDTLSANFRNRGHVMFYVPHDPYGEKLANFMFRFLRGLVGHLGCEVGFSISDDNNPESPVDGTFKFRKAHIPEIEARLRYYVETGKTNLKYKSVKPILRAEYIGGSRTNGGATVSYKLL